MKWYKCIQTPQTLLKTVTQLSQTVGINFFTVIFRITGTTVTVIFEPYSLYTHLTINMYLMREIIHHSGRMLNYHQT